MKNDESRTKLAGQLRACERELVDGSQLFGGEVHGQLGHGLDVGKVEWAAIGCVGSWGELHGRPGLIIDNLGLGAWVRSPVAIGQELHDLDPDPGAQGKPDPNG